MSGVSPFNSDDAVWHFHPVVFLNAINNSNYPKTPVNNELIPLEFLRFYNGDTIDDADYENAARTLQCEVAAIKAVAKTETGSSGSYFKFEQEDDYVPSILFERHHFHRYTNGVYDSQPDISNSRSGGYGTRSEQYQKLLRAYVLDKQAALKSASWGKFQILVSNYQAAGYSSPEEFIISISESEKNHLAAFINFIKSNPVLLRAIRDKDWLNFALCYNGQSQRGYDDRIRANYEQYR
ncbi:TPA: N-acetylmuramidase family protein [Escherichia coli]|nr:N-acetylmuramidase family protein [Escherichia coli]MCV5810332.1 N-acetylmuramidase family protein [Escherichia coli]HBB8296343.1 N-acetylmuramidase family protein [Escherichia coli]